MFIRWAVLFIQSVSSLHSNDLAWSGGPLHLQCEHNSDLFTNSGHFIKENVIAIKAVSFREDIYVLTPRLKPGVVATVWLAVRTRRGVELQPYPELRAHAAADCRALQNAIDFQLDHLGLLWVLDSGIVETAQHPRCTCPPKVVVISLLRGRLTRHIDLSSAVEPLSQLQNIAVEYAVTGKVFVYISDASRGAVLVHNEAADSLRVVQACAPAAGLQMVLTSRGLLHSALVLVRVPHAGLYEMDTTALKRQDTATQLKVFGELTNPVILLGASSHHVYLRPGGGADVFLWDTREPFNISRLDHIHSPAPRLVPTSVSEELLLHTKMILDSNYAETIHGNAATYHRITFIDNF